VWPLGAWAQKPTMPFIGFMNGTSPQGYGHFVAAFRRGLAETGYVEGQNVTIEYRWAQEALKPPSGLWQLVLLSAG
jgi:putative tryptophan/tyrosine transport system substrate-binding protein